MTKITPPTECPSCDRTPTQNGYSYRHRGEPIYTHPHCGCIFDGFVLRNQEEVKLWNRRKIAKEETIKDLLAGMFDRFQQRDFDTSRYPNAGDNDISTKLADWIIDGTQDAHDTGYERARADLQDVNMDEAIDTFVVRLFERFQERGFDATDCDGDDDAATIIADWVIARVDNAFDQGKNSGPTHMDLRDARKIDLFNYLAASVTGDHGSTLREVVYEISSSAPTTAKTLSEAIERVRDRRAREIMDLGYPLSGIGLCGP